MDRPASAARSRMLFSSRWDSRMPLNGWRRSKSSTAGRGISEFLRRASTGQANLAEQGIWVSAAPPQPSEMPGGPGEWRTTPRDKPSTAVRQASREKGTAPETAGSKAVIDRCAQRFRHPSGAEGGWSAKGVQGCQPLASVVGGTGFPSRQQHGFSSPRIGNLEIRLVIWLV